MQIYLCTQLLYVYLYLEFNCYVNFIQHCVMNLGLQPACAVLSVLDTMLGYRRWHRANIEPALVRRIVFVWMHLKNCIRYNWIHSCWKWCLEILILFHLAIILTTCSKILNTCILITLCIKVMCNKFKMCYMKSRVYAFCMFFFKPQNKLLVLSCLVLSCLVLSCLVLSWPSKHGYRHFMCEDIRHISRDMTQNRIFGNGGTFCPSLPFWTILSKLPAYTWLYNVIWPSKHGYRPGMGSNT